MKRTLSLRREALSDLTPAELGGVVGGYTSQNGISCDVRDCVGVEMMALTPVVNRLTTIPSQLLTCYTCVTP